jgi:CubicO group peptidase (beta-lactamase class C family)
MARIYGALARGGEIDGTQLLSAGALVRARTLQVNMRDELVVIKRPLPYRVGLGFMLHQPDAGDRRGANSFGSPGAGGSIGFADPDARLGFGYAMNQMWHATPANPDPRASSLIAAVYDSLSAA